MSFVSWLQANLPKFFPIESILAFLRIKLLDLPFIFIDVWSIVHFLVAALLLGNTVKRISIGIGIIIAYEILENMLMYWGIVLPETYIDTLWDIIVGIMGYLLYRHFVLKAPLRWW